MTKVFDIRKAINAFAPENTAMDFDNVGLLVGDPDVSVTSVLLALDVTVDIISQAEQCGAQLIVSHHPVIFQPLTKLIAASVPYLLAQKNISVISAHTNYDLAPDGVNYCLAEKLCLRNIRPFVIDPRNGLAEGLIGELDRSFAPKEFAEYVKEKLSCRGLSYTKGMRPVQTVAVGCGAGSYMLFDAIAAGVDGFVTGESKHHELLAAAEAGITMVTAGHFNTEVHAMLPLAEKLQKDFPDVSFIVAEQSDPVQYL